MYKKNAAMIFWEKRTRRGLFAFKILYLLKH